MPKCLPSLISQVLSCRRTQLFGDHSSHARDLPSNDKVLAMTGLRSTTVLSANVIPLFCAGHVLWDKTLKAQAQPPKSRLPCEGPEQETQRHQSVPGFIQGSVREV